jgi:chromosome segregation ATPase
MEELKGEVKDLRRELHDFKRELHDVKRELSEVRESLINIRERNYLTFLRDHVTGFNRTHRNRIYILNSSEVHEYLRVMDRIFR